MQAPPSQGILVWTCPEADISTLKLSWTFCNGFTCPVQKVSLWQGKLFEAEIKSPM